MSSSMDTNSIGHKLQSLEQRLRAENESHDRFLLDNNFGRMETTPNRQNRRMFLPVISSTPAPETETDKKLKDIMKQTGILTINGVQYTTDIKDLEHLGDLGNGTSGNVVKMRHVPSGTIIAVKQMRRTGNTEENKRILMDLDVVLKSDDSPYIVQCLGCFVRDPDVWICMELMSMCFDKLLKLSKKPVPEDILGKVTVATVKALSYLKEKHGVIHRDVKPSNILIDERGNIKLCDFGISGRLIESKANTRSAGCAAYMAPERIDPKKPKYDIRADVWSLGITLVELATARSPYEGCNTDFEVLTKVLDSDPPRLPEDKEFNFSPEFRDFVSKCLTKNHQNRPKYMELLQQPFIKKYEVANVDIPKWFQSVVESTGIKPHHRTIIPKANQDSTPNLSYNKNFNSNLIMTSAAPKAALTLTNANSYSQKQVPNFQQYNQNSCRRNENLHGYQQTQLPHPTEEDDGTSFYLNSNNSNGTINRNGSIVESKGVGNSSCSSSTASSSPLSPPNIGTTIKYINHNANANNEDDVSSSTGNGLSSENKKQYQKSQLFQRKLSTGNYDTSKVYGGIESPKKEIVPTTSMLSTIGQSIIRNLTTSPFSQKKHSIPQTCQIDPLWRIPVAQNATLPYDYDHSKVNKTYTRSPFLARKRIPTVDEKIIAAATGNTPDLLDDSEYENKYPQNNSIPHEKREICKNSQRAPGSNSPIVLQRFYHQQNQLREKEIEKSQHRHPSPDSQTNPFLSTYETLSPGITKATSAGPVSNFHYNQYYSHIPIPTATNCGGGYSTTSTSSHSTSSHSSSTLSSSSQKIPASDSTFNEKYDIAKALNLQSPAAFGVSNVGMHLQYQPLPQQYLEPRTIRNSRSPPTSPEQLSEPIGGSNSSATGSFTNKLNKIYSRRQLHATSSLGTSSLGTSSNGSSSRLGLGSDISANSSKKNDSREDHGWFNTLTGAMKRQFSSYIKLQLNPSEPAAPPTKEINVTDSPAVGSAIGTEDSLGNRKSFLPYYQRSNSLSGNRDISNSNSLLTTESRPKVGMDGNTGRFLRRYAASSGGSSSASKLGDFTSSSPLNAHILAGLDRRHKSPDPPPRYNRGQSPLLLRKNLLELSGQTPGASPLLNRRYVTASPPLPPPRRGSESVPGSPQHFRTRIHYTPEPQRRIYRAVDQ